MSSSIEPVSPRRAGLRMIAGGGVALVVGVGMLALIDAKTDRALSYPEIGSKPSVGVQFVAGLPATIGYVVLCVGVYRLVTGRGPGEERRAPVAVFARAMLVLLMGVVFFAGAYGIVSFLRAL